jgi:hypothetical protein
MMQSVVKQGFIYYEGRSRRLQRSNAHPHHHARLLAAGTPKRDGERVH